MADNNSPMKLSVVEVLFKNHKIVNLNCLLKQLYYDLQDSPHQKEINRLQFHGSLKLSNFTSFRINKASVAT